MRMRVGLSFVFMAHYLNRVSHSEVFASIDVTPFCIVVVHPSAMIDSWSHVQRMT